MFYALMFSLTLMSNDVIFPKIVYLPTKQECEARAKEYQDIANKVGYVKSTDYRCLEAYREVSQD